MLWPQGLLSSRCQERGPGERLGAAGTRSRSRPLGMICVMVDIPSRPPGFPALLPWGTRQLELTRGRCGVTWVGKHVASPSWRRQRPIYNQCPLLSTAPLGTRGTLCARFLISSLQGRTQRLRGAKGPVQGYSQEEEELGFEPRLQKTPKYDFLTPWSTCFSIDC